MVDLDGVAGALAALEGDRAPRVRVGQRAGEDDAVAGAGLERLAGQVPGEHVVAGVAAVAVGVHPAGSEQVAVVPGAGRPSLHLERGQGGQGRGGRGGADDGVGAAGVQPTGGLREAVRRQGVLGRLLVGDALVGHRGGVRGGVRGGRGLRAATTQQRHRQQRSDHGPHHASTTGVEASGHAGSPGGETAAPRNLGRCGGCRAATRRPRPEVRRRSSSTGRGPRDRGRSPVCPPARRRNCPSRGSAPRRPR